MKLIPKRIRQAFIDIDADVLFIAVCGFIAVFLVLWLTFTSLVVMALIKYVFGS